MTLGHSWHQSEDVEKWTADESEFRCAESFAYMKVKSQLEIGCGAYVRMYNAFLHRLEFKNKAFS